jgi:3-phytase
MKRLLLPLSLLLVSACATRTPPPHLPDDTPPAPVAQAVVEEAYVAAGEAGDELDSLATWTTEDGATWLIATAKRSHRLLVLEADSGETLRRFGGPGVFKRPNGIAVHGDLLLVAERDNHRAQAFRLPDFEPLAVIGEGELRSPYGLWLHETAPGDLVAYVTDSFMEGARFDVVPPFDQLDRRVRRYRLRPGRDGGLEVQSLGSFGDTSEANALRMVESIAGDPVFDRLLVADEDRRHLQTLHVYTLDGRHTGHKLPRGSFDGEPEGIALWACDAERGYWIVADQLQPLTVFRLFDRRTLAPRGAFTGTVTAWTDGITLHAAATSRFPHGALFAVHDDRAVSAFDLGRIAQALALDPACLD